MSLKTWFAKAAAMTAGKAPRARSLFRLCVALSVIGPVSEGFSAVADEPQSAWRLIRTSDPRGGPEAVAMTHVADASKSDMSLAGLMLRCSMNTRDVEVAVVTTVPFAPLALPQI